MSQAQNEMNQSFISSSENESTVLYNPRALPKFIDRAKYETPGSLRLIHNENSSNLYQNKSKNKNILNNDIFKPTLIKSLNVPYCRKPTVDSIERDYSTSSIYQEELAKHAPQKPVEQPPEKRSIDSSTSDEKLNAESRVSSNEIFYESSPVLENDESKTIFPSVYAINSLDDIIVYENQYLPLSPAEYNQFAKHIWEKEFHRANQFYPNFLGESFCEYVNVNVKPQGSPLADNSTPLDLVHSNIPKNCYAGPFFNCIDFTREYLTHESSLKAILMEEQSLHKNPNANSYRELLDTQQDFPFLASANVQGDLKNWWTSLVRKFTGSMTKEDYYEKYPLAKYVHFDSDDEFVEEYDDTDSYAEGSERFDSTRYDIEMRSFSRNAAMEINDEQMRNPYALSGADFHQGIGPSTSPIYDSRFAQR